MPTCCALLGYRVQQNGSRLGVGPARRNDVGDDQKPVKSDSQFSDSDRQDLEYARKRRQEYEHRAWLWALTKGFAKWTAVVAGGSLVVINTLKAILQAIRDGL